MVRWSREPERINKVSEISLTGLQVLVTRPPSQATELIAALKGASAEPIAFPVMAIEAIEEGDRSTAVQAIKRTVMDLDQYQHVIFISTNAVNCAFYWIEQYWPQMPVGIQYYAIGTATAKTLNNYGLESQAATGSMNSEALLALPSLQQLSGQKVVVFRGVGGREHLGDVMRQRGAQLEYSEVYRRKALKPPAGNLSQILKTHKQLLLSVSSGETLENLLQLAKTDSVEELLKTKPLLLPGQRVATLARQQGFQQVLIAENAGVAAFITELEKHQKNSL